MDCIDLFKKAAAAMQTDPRYLELDAARRENDNDHPGNCPLHPAGRNRRSGR